MTNAAITAVLGLSLLSILSTVIGFGLASRLGDRAEGIAVGIGFSVGTMLLLALVELLPEAARAGSWWSALAAGALGAVVVAALHLVVPHTHLVQEHQRADAPLVTTSLLVAVGLVLHDLPEGFALATGYLAAPRVGLVTALAIALHNVPEQFVMGLPATLTRDRRLLVTMAVLAAVAEPIGAVIGLLAVGVAPGANGLLVAFAAGAMAYVALHELVPLARRYGRSSWFAGGLVASGAVFAVLTALV